MAIDIRVDVGFRGSLKRKKLERIIGKEGIACLLDLWLYIREHRPKGGLNGMSNQDIAEVAGWGKNPDEFVNALIKERWIDEKDAEKRVLHNWKLRQPFSYNYDKIQKTNQENARKPRKIKVKNPSESLSETLASGERKPSENLALYTALHNSTQHITALPDAAQHQPVENRRSGVGRIQKTINSIAHNLGIKVSEVK